MAEISPGTAVAWLTAGAVAVICVLTVQASGEESDTAGQAPRPGPSTSRHQHSAAVPALSGTGKRVVYALGADRVWLVNRHERAVRTFTVVPGTVDPVPGTYRVDSRSGRTVGSDGVAVEHVVRFATFGSSVIGFSAATERVTQTPLPSQRTGGVRADRDDGTAIWTFAVVGVKVVVVR